MCGKIMCRTCGQPLPPVSREGVWLPAMKAQIFDFINKHPTVTADGIACHFSIKINSVRQHIYQINSLLAATNIRICGNWKYREGGYHRGEYRIIRAAA